MDNVKALNNIIKLPPSQILDLICTDYIALNLFGCGNNELERMRK
jgi:hypothetical protein